MKSTDRKQKSCVFLTTPTSGSESFWRLLYAIGAAVLQFRDELQTDPPMQYLSNQDIKKWRPKSSGEMYIYRRSFVANDQLMDDEIRLIVNMRDTRDIACNQFHWHLQHPIMPNMNDEQIVAHRNRVRQMGIDKFVLDWEDQMFLHAHRRVEERMLNDSKNVLNVSYNQLCLDFDALVIRIADFLDVPKNKIDFAAVEKERTENLAGNPLWIGNSWHGSDIMPGRYLNELKKETINLVNFKHSQSLIFIQNFEKAEFRSLLNSPYNF